MQELRPEILRPTIQATILSTQLILHARSPETLLQSRHAPRIEVPSHSTNSSQYLEVCDTDFELQRHSVPTNPIASSATPSCNTLTRTPHQQ